MANRFSVFLKKKVVGRDQNLVSLEEPFLVLKRILAGQQVSGILDAGASNASLSKRFLEIFPQARVFGFEPNPLYAEILQRFAREEPRFSPQFLALADRSGDAELLLTESPGNTSLFAPHQRLVDYDGAGTVVKARRTVPLVAFDEWRQGHGNPAVELMKFDIQGGELKALQGAVRTLRESTLAIFTEVLFNPLYEGGALFGDIDLFLREQGFVLYDFFKPKYHPRRLLLWGNAIYVQARKLGF